MGIHGDSLIKLCTLGCWVCDFSEVDVDLFKTPAGRKPKAVIDGNCWVYECACGISSGLCKERGFASYSKFLKTYKRRLNYVKKCGFDVIVVFDGRRLPLKQVTHQKREKAREKARQKAATRKDAVEEKNPNQKIVSESTSARSTQHTSSSTGS